MTCSRPLPPPKLTKKENTNQSKAELVKILSNVASFLNSRGLYAEALPLFEQSLKIARETFESDHTELATTINNVALHFKIRWDITGDDNYFNKSVKLFTELIEMRGPLS